MLKCPIYKTWEFFLGNKFSNRLGTQETKIGIEKNILKKKYISEIENRSKTWKCGNFLTVKKAYSKQ